MSRQIDYRVWDGKEMWDVEELRFEPNGGWVAYGSWINRKPEDLPWASHSSGQNGLEHPVLMQYAGPKDANRQEIYEDDILEIDFRDGIYDEPQHAVVKYSTSSGFMSLEHIEHPTGGWTLNTYTASCSRIIGNIHQNPELLQNDAARINMKP